MCHTLNTEIIPAFGRECGGIHDIINGGPTELGEKGRVPFLCSSVLDDCHVFDFISMLPLHWRWAVRCGRWSVKGLSHHAGTVDRERSVDTWPAPWCLPRHQVSCCLHSKHLLLGDWINVQLNESCLTCLEKDTFAICRAWIVTSRCRDSFVLKHLCNPTWPFLAPRAVKAETISILLSVYSPVPSAGLGMLAGNKYLLSEWTNEWDTPVFLTF